MKSTAGIGVLLGIAALGCGGAAPPVESPPPAPVVVESQPARDTEIAIETQTTGASLQVEVVGRGRAYRAGEAFERSEQWRVMVSADGVPLRRLLNGPARIEREPSDNVGDLWDVTVAFSVAFAVPEGASALDVTVEEPGGRTANRRVSL